MGEIRACEVTAVQKIGVAADIKIVPSVLCGKPKVVCLDTKVLPVSDGCMDGWEPTEGAVCSFRVFQELCVEVPLAFALKADCKPAGVFCGPPMADEEAECEDPDDC